ncbi:sigma-70 family RNA polymerase sigma factor [Herpetosiphon llansteffanensis]|uniref:sigma-70 family RNA polymerase sigma factor n=1 Tax=Herpetosiphon llansteffanensis TaxID=2094568 RepID=UPI0013DFA3C1|nr:sigma-70 family RNA polymerase sigma factor [Herpetosiphon llansteffanensis]
MDIEETIRGEWRQMQSRYSWLLVGADDLEDFLAAITADMSQRQSQTDGQLQAKAVIQQHYYRRTYDAIIKHKLNPRDPGIAASAQQACAEVYALVWRLVMERGYDSHLAEDIGQKVVERLLTRPDKVKSPEALMMWACWQMRDFLKQANNQKRAADSLDQAQLGEDREGEEKIVRETASIEDTSSQVETDLFIQEIFDLLPNILSDFQQQVINLVVVQGYMPSELVEQLQTTARRIRVEKSRALAIIRAHPRIKKWLELA